ncbi:hypothetical protein [Aliagarivorans marinus]|uniref:hypothetical protein n=1 Tax=Aliagarivorans marinus TaxID=561965 RepID=UPI0004241EAA|nr:hypothetical protein [Aliagarivorans marinus]
MTQTQILSLERKQVVDVITERLLLGDWRVMTLSYLAEYGDWSEEQLAQLFPSYQVLVVAVNQSLTQHFVDHLDLSSRERLRESWLESLDSSHFSAIVMLFLDASQEESVAWRLANVGWTVLSNQVAAKLGYHAVNEDLPWLLGKSMLMLVNQRKHFPTAKHTAKAG